MSNGFSRFWISSVCSVLRSSNRLVELGQFFVEPINQVGMSSAHAPRLLFWHDLESIAATMWPPLLLFGNSRGDRECVSGRKQNIV
jgi:hypothetical protein